MTEQDRKEEFSVALVHAIAATAGYCIGTLSKDRDSIDLLLVADKNTLKRSPMISVQLKCSSQDFPSTDDDFSFPLEKKNYDDLREETTLPRLLLVVRVPAEPWIIFTEQKTELFKCCYWRSLLGEPASENTTSVTVKIPRANVLTTESLVALMTKANSGQPL